MKKIIFIMFLGILASISFAEEGFVSSYNKNVFLVKGPTSGATAFLINLPKLGKVLMTQVHVIENLGNEIKLYYGAKVQPFFKIKKNQDDFFEINLIENIIWQNKELDVAILEPSDDLLKQCDCSGFELDLFTEGYGTLIGYPIIGRRTYPRKGKFWTSLGELFGTVQQMQSSGNIWNEKKLIVADIDALPGNSGGPILNEAGNAIGIIYRLKTWYGVGYKYLNPHIEITTINTILNKLDSEGF